MPLRRYPLDAPAEQLHGQEALSTDRYPVEVPAEQQTDRDIAKLVSINDQTDPPPASLPRVQLDTEVSYGSAGLQLSPLSAALITPPQLDALCLSSSKNTISIITAATATEAWRVSPAAVPKPLHRDAGFVDGLFWQAVMKDRACRCPRAKSRLQRTICFAEQCNHAVLSAPAVPTEPRRRHLNANSCWVIHRTTSNLGDH